MLRTLAASFLLLVLGSSAVTADSADRTAYANDRDTARARRFAEREADWRNGALVYQVIVDRFAPAADLEAKRDLYPSPKVLRPWSEPPKRGHEIKEAGVWSHELDFWGGDLQSLRTRLDYVEGLGIDVLYLNPIHRAWTNHKYDAQNYFEVSPEYGTRDDVRALADELHSRQMRLVLDGVLNHMGRTSPWFEEAMTSATSPWRDWFVIGPEYRYGYRAWYNVRNLPELNLENPEVRARIWGDPDSVIQGYLREGVDGWRLDVAFDIGFNYLAELTLAAHRARPGSLVIGEIWNYPEEWMPALDGVMNMTLRSLLLRYARGELGGARFGELLDTMVSDTGIEPLLKSWLTLDNHDTPRLRTVLPEPWQQRLAQVLQMTLPGSPSIYYGVELGMQGGDDPENRGPMQWELVNDDNEHLAWMKKLIAMRRDSRGLRIGDFRLLPTSRALAFQRSTDRAGDYRLVAANAEETTVTETVMLRESKIMSGSVLRDELAGGEVQTMAGTIQLVLPPRSAVVFRPVLEPPGDYTPYKRVQ